MQHFEAYFWATHSGSELDLLLLKNGIRLGIEIKRADAPRLTRAMQTACTDLALAHLLVIYPGQQVYPLNPQITVMPLEGFGIDSDNQVLKKIFSEIRS